MSQYINPYRLFHGAMIPNWLLMRPNAEINSSAKMVYARLGQYAGKKGVAFPCKRTLAGQVGLSLDAVDKCIEALEALGLIEVTRRPQPGGSHRSNEYRFLEHDWMWAEDDEEDEDIESEGGGGTGSPPRGDRKPPYRGQEAPQRGDRRPPNLRESVETNHEANQSGSVGAPRSTDKHPPASPGESGPALHDRNQDPKDAAKEELIAPELSESASDWFESQKNALIDIARRKRIEGTTQAALEKNAEARARKAGNSAARAERKRYRPEVDELPLEEPQRTPLSQLSHVWRAEMSETFPDVPVPKKWGMKEYGQAKLLLERYDRDQVEVAMVYAIRNWEALRQRLFKGSGGPTPSVGVILKLHEVFFPESVVWAEHGRTVEEYEAYGSPNTPRPSELFKRYAEAVKRLKDLGITV